jgi:hypothetical protein
MPASLQTGTVAPKLRFVLPNLLILNARQAVHFPKNKHFGLGSGV